MGTNGSKTQCITFWNKNWMLTQSALNSSLSADPWQNLCFASERRRLMVRFQFSCQMLVVIPVFTHQTVKLGGKAGYQIRQKCNSEGERFQDGHSVTKMTSATSLPTVAVTPSHTKDWVSLFSAGPSFLLLSAWQSWAVHFVLLMQDKNQIQTWDWKLQIPLVPSRRCELPSQH